MTDGCAMLNTILKHLLWLPLATFHGYLGTLAPRWMFKMCYVPAGEAERQRSQQARNFMRRADYESKKSLIP